MGPELRPVEREWILKIFWKLCVVIDLLITAMHVFVSISLFRDGPWAAIALSPVFGLLTWESWTARSSLRLRFECGICIVLVILSGLAAVIYFPNMGHGGLVSVMPVFTGILYAVFFGCFLLGLFLRLMILQNEQRRGFEVVISKK